MNQLYENELENIVSVAGELFLENTITGTSIKEIAKRAGCGEASVYRHYQTKQNLAVKAATRLADQVRETYFNVGGARTGFAQIRSFYEAYTRVFCEDCRYYRFTFELDNIYLGNTDTDCSGYETAVEKYYQIFHSAYQKGLADGSVREIADIELFYASSAHAVLNLCKFLSVTTSPLRQDRMISPEAEIRALIEMILQNVINDKE